MLDICQAIPHRMAASGNRLMEQNYFMTTQRLARKSMLAIFEWNINLQSLRSSRVEPH